MGRFLIGFILGGVCIFGAQRYHVVNSKEGVLFVPKMSATLSETYVDVRNFTQQDWVDHPALAAALVRDGKSSVLQGAVVDSLGSGAERLLQSLRR